MLRGTVGLYVEQNGQHIEATTACRAFISHLHSLLDAVKASTPATVSAPAAELRRGARETGARGIPAGKHTA